MSTTVMLQAAQDRLQDEATRTEARVREYVNSIIHDWLQTLTILGYTLVPVFFFLDYFIIPESARGLFPRFGVYRGVVTAFILAQFFVIRRTKPSNFSFLHGYAFNIAVSLMIILMTLDLGGFDSSYYAGLNLVIIAVNLLLPWRAIHSAVNGLITVLMYLAVNLIWGGPFLMHNLVNNLYFMLGTVVIAASINHVKHILVRKEYMLREEVVKARDALWGEMEIAKRIQTALLPTDPGLLGYEIAATMMPADEVGGDYYDIIPADDRKWILIGDVSGHGVESGLIMMMTQTSVRSMIKRDPDTSPSRVLSHVNSVIKDNITRLGAERYMTISALSLNASGLKFAGKHQDILVYRGKQRRIETVPTHGAWIGVLDDIDGFLQDGHIALDSGDILLLFTDGITEAENKAGEMFGQERLSERLSQYAPLPVKDILSNILRDVTIFQDCQLDDLTLLIIKKN